MNFKEYQARARSSAIYPNCGSNYIYPVLGLCGESGEVAEKFKKVIRDNNGIVTGEQKEQITKELGDCMWYISNICSELCLDLEDVAENNLLKLKDRKERNALRGSGDNR